ncbi:MAG: HD domain-containing protein [Acetobacteraceae bacterium]
MHSRRRAVVLADLFAHVPLRPGLRADIRRRMSSPARHYHGLDHIADLWALHRLLSCGHALPLGCTDRLIAAAIVYHDAIFDLRRSDNEPASAALWRSHARLGGRLPRQQIARVAAAIEATGHHATGNYPGAASDSLRNWMLDLDLATIGFRAQHFRSNAARLRAESRLVPAMQWRQRTKEFLGALRRKEQIFHCPRIARAFESMARINLSEALKRLARDAARDSGHAPAKHVLGSAFGRSRGAGHPGLAHEINDPNQESPLLAAAQRRARARRSS